MVIVQNEQIVAINRQLLMEYSELQSGVIIYKKSQNILLMHSPSQIKELSLWCLQEFKIIGTGKP